MGAVAVGGATTRAVRCTGLSLRQPRLTFLKRPALVAVVRGLADQPDVRAALVAAGVPDKQHPAYAAALRGLAAADMIRPRTAAA